MKLACVTDEIWTEHLPDTSLELYTTPTCIITTVLLYLLTVCSKE